RNVCATGIMRDMGQGLSVDVFEDGSRSYGKHHFHTLDPAPADEVTTVEEQWAWIDNWWTTARVAPAVEDAPFGLSESGGETDDELASLMWSTAPSENIVDWQTVAWTTGGCIAMAVVVIL